MRIRFRAKLGLRFRNLGGGGRTLELDGKHSSIEDRVVSTFTNPQLWTSRNDFVLQSGYIRRYLPGFTDKSYFTHGASGAGSALEDPGLSGP